MENYYEILGVSNLATFTEIRDAYRKKVKELHPDKENGDAELFKKVKEAYESLSQDEKRNRYDELFFNKNNHIKNKTKPTAAPHTVSKILIINKRKKNQKLIPLSLSLHAAFILIGILGKKYLNKDRN